MTGFSGFGKGVATPAPKFVSGSSGVDTYCRPVVFSDVP